MSADPIWTLGYTYRDQEALSNDVAVSVIKEHLEKVRDLLPELDELDMVLRGYIDENVDENGFGKDGIDYLPEILFDAYRAHVEKDGDQAEYVIPSKAGNLVFALRSEAEYSFESVYILLLLLGAIDKIPEFGEALGILGSGIIIPEA